MLYTSIFQDKKMATKFQFSSSQIRVPVGRGRIDSKWIFTRQSQMDQNFARFWQLGIFLAPGFR